ncbi:aspartic peptidase domain-containing protein, partial [Mycena rebaudengoi]
LIVDTGSGNTWVGAAQPYVKTSTRLVEITIHTQNAHEYLDQVTLAPGLVISNQSIGAARIVEGEDFRGARDTLSTQNTIIPTVTDNAFRQDLISSNQIGISFEPVDEDGVFNGEITWGNPPGGYSAYNLSRDANNSEAPGFDPHWTFQQSIAYGGESIMPSAPGMVESGTTLIWLSPDAFLAYELRTGAGFDPNTQTGLLTITPAQFENLQSLFFTINGVTYEFPPSAQVWPPALNAAIGGHPDMLYLVVASLQTPTPGFINGFFHTSSRFYSVFDTSTHRVGLANTPHTLR